MIIDTHSHIYVDDFHEDIDDVVARAKAAGVERVFLPNINAGTIEPMLALCRRYEGFCFPMLGLHPEDLGDNWRDELKSMEKLLQSANPYIAVGEVGLDYYWDKTLYEEQQEAFAIQANWAIHFGLPLMIHTRSAHREMVDVLSQLVKSKSSNSQISGVFHCFGGSADEAEELLRFDGFMLGIGGVLTYKNSKLPDVLRSVVPLSRIVVETDSPYLAPVPHRGKRNESSFITEVVKRLSEIYETSESFVAEQTTINTLKTFPKVLLTHI